MTTVPAPVDALQRVLGGEHAALFVYSVLGGRISRSDARVVSSAVGAAYATHRARRDRLQVMIRQLGGEPVAPALAYDLATPAETPAQISQEARGIEARCAEVYAQAVADTTGEPRRWAVDALTDAAVRGLGFGGQPDAFPGLAEL